MSRPCTCEQCQRESAAPYTPDQCRLCWLYHHDRAYRALWDGQTALPCQHLGPATGDNVVCPSCAGSVALKLFACAVHGRCTLARPSSGVACCATCAAYQPTDLGDDAGLSSQ